MHTLTVRTWKLLNYGPAAKQSHLTTVLWYDDTAEAIDGLDGDNIDLVSRRNLLSYGKSVDLIGHLHGDVFNQEKLLLNEVEMRMRLVKSRDSFSLMDPSRSIYARIEESCCVTGSC